MTRTTIIALAILASAATAIAAINPADRTEVSPRNVTVIEKNQAFPVFGEIEVDECAIEDCSEVAKPVVGIAWYDSPPSRLRNAKNFRGCPDSKR